MMYFDDERCCLREFPNMLWREDDAGNNAFPPFIFWYIDIRRKVGLGAFPFDWLIWRNRHFFEGFESVTSFLEPAGDDYEDEESVTERTCVICGGSMEGKRAHAETCSPKCRKALSRNLATKTLR